MVHLRETLIVKFLILTPWGATEWAKFAKSQILKILISTPTPVRKKLNAWL